MLPPVHLGSKGLRVIHDTVPTLLDGEHLVDSSYGEAHELSGARLLLEQPTAFVELRTAVGLLTQVPKTRNPPWQVQLAPVPGRELESCSPHAVAEINCRERDLYFERQHALLEEDG
jgi:hypothetical protein